MITSCSSADEEEDKFDEGVIVYEISYPKFKATGLTAALMPDEMVMSFKDGQIRIDVSRAHAFSLVSLANSNDHTMSTVFNYGTKQMAANLDKADIDRTLEEFPSVDYIHTEETDTVAGYTCEKSIALFHNASDEVELLYTDEIDIDNPNWNTPYSEIDGMLLQYDVERYGMTMRFRAKEVRKEKVDAKLFTIPKGFKKVSVERIDKELQELFDIVLGNV